MTQPCEMYDMTTRDKRAKCEDKSVMVVVYQVAKVPHHRAMCQHHLDWFLASSLVREGAYDPVSLYPASYSVPVGGL